MAYSCCVLQLILQPSTRPPDSSNARVAAAGDMPLLLLGGAFRSSEPDELPGLAGDLVGVSRHWCSVGLRWRSEGEEVEEASSATLGSGVGFVGDGVRPASLLLIWRWRLADAVLLAKVLAHVVALCGP